MQTIDDLQKAVTFFHLSEGPCLICGALTDGCVLWNTGSPGQMGAAEDKQRCFLYRYCGCGGGFTRSVATECERRVAAQMGLN